MSEPAAKRHKADLAEAAASQPQVQELGPGEGPADANGDAQAAPEYMVDLVAAELEECQRALDKVNDEASDRVLAVEVEYNKKRRPIYSERAEIIKKVPQFWQRALSSHPTLADQLTDYDATVLEYVTELDVVDFDDIKSGFKIVLGFSSDNPFFSNPSLTKSFHYRDDGKVTITAATIDWSEGHAPTVPGLDGQYGGPSYMFFTWMATNEPVGAGTPDEIAEVLKDEIWPNPVKYYYSPLLGQREYEDAEDEGAMLEAEEFEGVLVEAAEGDVEGEEDDLVYDEGEGEMEAGGLGGLPEEGGLAAEEEGEEGAGGAGDV